MTPDTDAHEGDLSEVSSLLEPERKRDGGRWYVARVDEAEARELLSQEEARLRRLRYEQLRRFETARSETRKGTSGVVYQLEIEAVWDDGKRQNLRLVLSIDDGGWRSLKPLAASFIVAPDGSFVGE
ncbi:MAG: hypothetical protein ACREN2_09875 [Candidatus Dormibacteria bacterium]